MRKKLSEKKDHLRNQKTWDRISARELNAFEWEFCKKRVIDTYFDNRILNHNVILHTF